MVASSRNPLLRLDESEDRTELGRELGLESDFSQWEGLITCRFYSKYNFTVQMYVYTEL